MGDLNISLVLRAVVSDIKQGCQAETEHHNIRDCVSVVIIDDIVLFKILLAMFLQYFEVVL